MTFTLYIVHSSLALWQCELFEKSLKKIYILHNMCWWSTPFITLKRIEIWLLNSKLGKILN